CHAGDGKGHPFTTLTRFGQVDETGNQYLGKGGPQLQHRSLPGFIPETLPEGVPFARFTPPGNTGLGFLEQVRDSDLLSLEDPDDADGDGISGTANWITVPEYTVLNPGAIERNGKYIGRFGKKAGVYNLQQQTINAYNQDMGITSSYSPYDTYSNLETDAEISVQTINNVVFYLQTLKAPIQRDQQKEQIVHGKDLFIAAGCENCHKQSLQTRETSIEALANKTFSPYTDLLLHDMGPGLDDGYTEGNAKTYEWRTAPLWGLGLSPNSQGGEYFLMHDGRAKSIEEAIGMHGGEGSHSRDIFVESTSVDKESILAFLKSL
ncbi:MAG TPA: di-heme oxidoredictase family protein, partial [Chryseolinea sp.]|nr:di-heme oxidoredictase family protein [Chryseolinea sp.]